MEKVYKFKFGVNYELGDIVEMPDGSICEVTDYKRINAQKGLTGHDRVLNDCSLCYFDGLECGADNPKWHVKCIGEEMMDGTIIYDGVAFVPVDILEGLDNKNKDD